MTTRMRLAKIDDRVAAKLNGTYWGIELNPEYETKIKAKRTCDITYHGNSGYDAKIRVRKGSVWNCRLLDGFPHIRHGFVDLEIDFHTLRAVFGIGAKAEDNNT